MYISSFLPYHRRNPHSGFSAFDASLSWWRILARKGLILKAIKVDAMSAIDAKIGIGFI
jgi:hypothetical protein